MNTYFVCNKENIFSQFEYNSIPNEKEFSLSFFNDYAATALPFDKPLYMVSQKTGEIWQVMNITINSNRFSFWETLVKLEKLPGKAKKYLDLMALLLNELGGKDE